MIEIAVAAIAAITGLGIAWINRQPPRVITETSDEIAERDELLNAYQRALLHCLEEHMA